MNQDRDPYPVMAGRGGKERLNLRALDLRDRPAAQHATLLVGLALWAGIYALWFFLLAGVAVGGDALRRIVFALQSTIYIAVPIFLLLPVAVIPIRRSVRVVGITLAAALMLLHFLSPPESLYSHLYRDLALVALAIILGGLLGWRIADNRHIIPAFIVLFVVDVWSVFFGFTRTVSESLKLTQHVLIGSPVQDIPVIRPLVGPTDVLILVACLAMAMKFQLGLLRSSGYLAGGVFAGFLFVAFLGRPLPLLPFLVTAFAIGHHRTLPVNFRNIVAAVAFSACFITLLTFIVSG